MKSRTRTIARFTAARSAPTRRGVVSSVDAAAGRGFFVEQIALPKRRANRPVSMRRARVRGVFIAPFTCSP